MEQLVKLVLNKSVLYFLNKVLFGCLLSNHNPEMHSKYLSPTK